MVEPAREALPSEPDSESPARMRSVVPLISWTENFQGRCGTHTHSGSGDVPAPAWPGYCNGFHVGALRGFLPLSLTRRFRSLVFTCLTWGGRGASRGGQAAGSHY